MKVMKQFRLKVGHLEGFREGLGLGQIEYGQTEFGREQVHGVFRQPPWGRGQTFEQRELRVLVAQQHFLVLRAVAAEEVKAGALVLDEVGREEVPKRFAKTMTGGEFCQVAEASVGEGVVINSDHQFAEQGEGVTYASGGADVVTAE